MYYLIGRDLDGDGKFEFIRDMDNMILTDDANRALQMTENELDYIDMAYLNEAGFYAMEASRFKVSLLEALLFHPVIRGYRPRVAPPPRRPRRPHKAPPRSHLLGIFGIPVPPKPPRPPKPRPAPRRKPKPAPAPRPHAAGPRAAVARPAAKPAPLHRKTVTPGRPGAARPAISRPKIGGGPSGAGRGGRGPGRR